MKELSQHFNYKKLLLFVYPTVLMMVFTSIYSVVDGFFVSNFAGKTAFASINLIFPVIMALSALGFMLGTGGAALVSKILGEGDPGKARACFSLIVLVTAILGVFVTVAGIFILRPVAVLLGAEGEMLENCVLYGSINMGGLTAFMLQNLFQSFFPVAEKPKLGLFIVVAAGVTNAILDAVFIAGFGWGLTGAAVATVSGQIVGGIIPLLYFLFNRKGVLWLVKPSLSFKQILKACANGSSEMLTNLSLSFVNILYNYQLMRFLGEDGVSAFGFIMYVGFIFISVFLGFAVGVAPIVGFNYGADNREELKNVFKKSLIIVLISGAVMLALSLSLNYPLAYIFVGYDGELMALTRHGFYLYSLSFFICGFNIFGSAFFTALNNGVISAIMSFMRTLLLQVAAIFLLPLWFGTDGIWVANVAAECVALAITATFILTNKNKYGYI